MSASDKKHCIIFQSKNQEQRLLSWILYHKYQGFDKFIYFDDFSEDCSIDVANNLKNKYHIDLTILKTDGVGSTYNLEQTKNSNLYGGMNFVNRIIRSYNTGIDLLKTMNISEDSFVAFLDIDEFLVSDSAIKITDLLNNQSNNHLYIQSFDIKSFSLNNFYIGDEETKFRWCEESRKKTIFKERGKSIIKLKNLTEPLRQDNNIVHILYDTGFVFCPSNYIRIHHFRNPPLSNEIDYIEDYSLIAKAKEVQKYYEI